MKDIPVLVEDRYEAMAYSDLVLAACGTATLEAALLNTPVVTFYRISPLTYSFGKPFVNIKEYSIVNILSGDRVIPELIQKEFTAENIYAETEKILSSQETKERMTQKFADIKETLSEGNLNASVNVARELEKIIQKKGN
jgi:lipid-A-disaccharide synthase